MPRRRKRDADGSIGRGYFTRDIGHEETSHCTVTCSRNWSNVFSPIPGTSVSWSTEVKGPFSSRWRMIASALEGPMPLSCCSSSEEAVLTLTV